MPIGATRLERIAIRTGQRRVTPGGFILSAYLLLQRAIPRAR